jgi:hypothetical protein
MARFEIFVAMKIQVVVFWVMMRCSVVMLYRRFGGPCCPKIHPVGSKVFRNIDILLHQYTVLEPEDGSSKVLRNIGILLHQYTASQPGRSRIESGIM